MDFISVGGNAYTVRGGIQLDSCEVFTNSEFGYFDLPPSVRAQLRNTRDEKPIYMNTLFGKIIGADGSLLPSDDINRTDGEFKLYAGTTVEAMEVKPDAVQAVLAAASLSAVCIEQLKLLKQYQTAADITIEAISIIEGKINTIWNTFKSSAVFTGSLVSGGSTSVSATASGFPVPGSAVYNYQDRWGIGTLKVKLVN